MRLVAIGISQDERFVSLRNEGKHTRIVAVICRWDVFMLRSQNSSPILIVCIPPYRDVRFQCSRFEVLLPSCNE